MRKKRVILLCLIGAAPALTFLLTYNPTSREPSYDGHPLSYWVDGAHVAATSSRPIAPPANFEFDDFGHREIRAIGTNGLPWLLKWIQYEPHPVPGLIMKVLPRSFWNTAPGRSIMPNGPEADRPYAAVYAISILGTNATPALSQLAELMRNSHDTNTAVRAMSALGSLGDASLPAFEAALSDTNQPDRFVILESVFNMARGTTKNKCLPILMKACNDPELKTRLLARKYLAALSPPALTNAPTQ